MGPSMAVEGATTSRSVRDLRGAPACPALRPSQVVGDGQPRGSPAEEDKGAHTARCSNSEPVRVWLHERLLRRP